MKRNRATELERIATLAVESHNKLVHNIQFKLIYLEFKDYATLSYEAMHNGNRIRLYADRSSFGDNNEKRKAKEALFSSFIVESISVHGSALIALRLRDAVNQQSNEEQGDPVQTQ